ncbi:MAG: hypothetical protein HZA93_01840 [Verrucomicrobia bacterium]|nr:hypothetical protein [Verrucomicrobiota bacterium]
MNAPVLFAHGEGALYLFGSMAALALVSVALVIVGLVSHFKPGSRPKKSNGPLYSGLIGLAVLAAAWFFLIA